MWSVIFIIGIIGCNDEPETIQNTYISGEIVNPEREYVIISKNDQILDSVPLDEMNRFSYQVKNVGNDHYFIRHGSENQLIHLTPGDSLLLRVNTLDFDESLNFSGPGSEKNNFLLNMYLLDKKNTDLLLSHYKMEPTIFAKKSDSIKERRLETLEKLDEKHEFPDDFKELAEKIIQYEFYDLRERYTFLVNKYYEDFSGKFPEKFHDYRKKANFNDRSLQANPSYLRFIGIYLINKSINTCLEREPQNNRKCFNLNDIENIKTRIKLVDSLIEVPSIKKYFLGKLGAHGIVMAKNQKDLVSLVALLKEEGMSEEKLSEMRQLGILQMAFFPGVNLGKGPLLTPEGKKLSIADVSLKPSIMYFWSIYEPAHHQEQHKKIMELQKKYPEITFLGLNIDVGQSSKWLNAVRKYGYNMDNEFQIALENLNGKPLDPSLFKHYLNKLLFLDASGKVILGDTNLYAPNFETQVLEFLNR